MIDFKRTYPVEVELAERNEAGESRIDKIDVPYVSSAEYFEIIESPEIKKFIDAGKLSKDQATQFIMQLGRKVTDTILPGILATLRPSGGFDLIGAILQREAKTFGLGETKGAKPLKKTSTKAKAPPSGSTT